MASNRIKGITVEIGGNATKLQTALQGVNKTLRTIDAELRDVDKLLKLDPGNTELLAQKQKYLTEAIAATNEKLSQLKDVSKDALSDDEWEAVQREIIDTEQALTKYTDQLKNLGSVDATAQNRQHIQELNKDLNDTEKALSSVNKSLKLDPGNADLLAQKQKLLTSEINNTKTKLQELRTVQSQTSDAKEWDKLQDEISQTEAKLNSLEKEYKEFGSVAKQQVTAVGENIKKVGGNIKDFGNTLTTHVTVPLAAAAAGAVKGWEEIDKAQDVIIEKTGATGDKLADMTDSMKNIYSSVVVENASQVGEAIGEVNTRFNVQGEELEKLSEKYIKFAQLNNTDVSSSIDSTQKALSAFGLSAKEAPAFLDRLNKVSQDTGVDVNKLTDGLIQNGAAFQELGLSIDQSTEFMGQLEKSGANSETVLSGMRRALKNATEEGVPLNDALQNLQNTIKTGKNGVDGLTASYDLFGKSGDQIYKAVQNGTVDFANLGKAAQDAGGSVEKTFEETLDPLDQAKLILQNLQLLGAEIVEAAGPMITEVMEQLLELVQSLREIWDSLDEGEQEAVIKFALIAAAAGPLLSTLGGIVELVGGIMTVAPVAGEALAAIGTAAAPIALVAGAVAGVGYAFKEAYDSDEEFRKEVDDTVSEISDSFDGLKHTVADSFRELFDYFGVELKEGASDAEVFEKAVDLAMDGIADGALNVFKRVADNIKLFFENTADVIKITTAGITGDEDEMADAISSIFNRIAEEIEKRFNEVVENIKKFFDFTDLDIPLPELVLEGKLDIAKGEIPHFDIKWHQMGYDQALLLNNASIFGTAGGRPLGGGEGSGSEMVIGTEKLLNMISEAAGGDQGDIVIPVYIGQEQLETMVVTAQQRAEYRSGGR